MGGVGGREEDGVVEKTGVGQLVWFLTSANDLHRSDGDRTAHMLAELCFCSATVSVHSFVWGNFNNTEQSTW